MPGGHHTIKIMNAPWSANTNGGDRWTRSRDWDRWSLLLSWGSGRHCELEREVRFGEDKVGLKRSPQGSFRYLSTRFVRDINMIDQDRTQLEILNYELELLSLLTVIVNIGSAACAS